MLKKHSLLTIALFFNSITYANIPIENRGLTQLNTAIETSQDQQPLNTNINWQLMQKSQELENDLRVLRGKIEEQIYEIDQIKKDLANRYTDLDQRLEILNQKIDPENASPSEESTSEEINQPTTATNDDLGSAKQETTNSNEMDKAAYTVALDAYKKGGAAEAIAPMKNFIKNHPESIYTPNAYFWLAEFYLAINPVNYKQAKENYKIVVDKYPKSSKAPRALFQLFSIAKNVDHEPSLAMQYKNQLLKLYPQTEEAELIQK